jgi:sugar/nucleoside kinase (ribokinase family)
VIALLGNLSRDLFPGREPTVGGGPFHAARALRLIGARAQLYTRCALADREALVLPVASLGTPVQYVPGESTATFRIAYDGEQRTMEVDELGDRWLPGDVPALGAEVRWVHVAPLLRSDFQAETLATVARGRFVAFDGQGLVRVPELGELRLDGAYDPALLEHITVLKLADEEAEVVGDPAALGVPEVIVTHGSRGSTVYTAGRSEDVPAFGVAAEPTGAGDAFLVAYVAARSRDFVPAAAARRATAVVGDLLVA